MTVVPQPPSEAEEAQEVQNEIDHEYRKTVKEEADKEITDVQQKTTAEFQRLHGMGFVSKKDMESTNKELVERLAALEAEHTKLREFLLRRKAQGKSVVPTEEKKTEAEELRDIYGDLFPTE